MNSLEAFINEGLLKCASTCKLKITRYGVLDKKMKTKFGTSTHRSEGLLDYITLMFRVLRRLHHLEAIKTLSRLLMIYLGDVGYTL